MDNTGFPRERSESGASLVIASTKLDHSCITKDRECDKVPVGASEPVITCHSRSKRERRLDNDLCWMDGGLFGGDHTSGTWIDYP
jgi:hypothetical protein